ncbi:hypothetical protein BN14_08383 [Rhizoctonia solani AG-1 IB]|uniref:Nephrocystin 3-like N-terminal domain-containing protein n=1 Tax=Thanatephorus cucumeris (strain AG1-IB / isolate 7/3/14) TaxID=1108050 RepID=M5C2U2_THACB|nr:hypothetical protein BN14_08383 [Rhizoctonia solani AG-1 IB]
MSSPPSKKRGIRASIAHSLSKLVSLKSPNNSQGTREEPCAAASGGISLVPSSSSLPLEIPGASSPGAMATPPSTLTPDPVETSAFNSFASALRILSQCATVFPPLQAAVQGLIVSVDAMNPSSKHRVEYTEIAAHLTAMSTSLARHLQESKSTRMPECIERVSISVKQQADIIASKQRSGVGHHLDQARKEDDEIINAYRRIESLFRLLQADTTLSVWNTVDEHLANTRIEALSPSKLAAHNSMLGVEVKRRACASNTRIELLRKINHWSHDPDAPNIYWMNGMAGTGKTTIAYTFSESLKARNDPDIGTQTITHQFERLIKEPLASVKDAMPTGLVIVIDALDECSNTEGVRMILDMLFRMATSLPLKFFVTSRPEPSVHSRVLAQPDKTRLLFVLHEIESSLVQADIEVYLREELPVDKVSDTQLKQLAELAGNLFIYAATAIRYIRRAGGSIDQKRLGIVLSSAEGSGHQYAEVDRLYTSILADATESSDLDVDEKKQVYVVVWTAVCVREPVTIKTLAAIIGSEPDNIAAALSSLFSVLHVSKATGAVSTLHASFPDFIFDQARSKRFHCNELEMNEKIAEHCFSIMDQQLRFNLCGLESSFKYDHEVDGLEARVSEAISPTLLYVIGHWGDHLVPVNWAAVLDGSTEPQRYTKRRDQHAIEAKAMADGC